MREYRGHITGIHVSKGGVPKRPVESAEVGTNGLTNDRQTDRKAHGGPMKALCLYAEEAIATLADEGHNIAPGHLGENITMAGIDWSEVKPGARFKLGAEVECEVTSYTQPCWKNAHWFKNGDITRILQDQNPGWSRVYARVLSGGEIRTGDAVVLTIEDASERVPRRQPTTYRWAPP